MRVPQAGWQFVLLAVRVQVTPAPDGSFWTLAKKATVLLPAGIALILLVIDTAIAGVMTLKVSESDLDVLCTDVAVNVGRVASTDPGGE